ncbi:putative ribosomal protein L14P [Helianthus anomalus]
MSNFFVFLFNDWKRHYSHYTTFAITPHADWDDTCRIMPHGSAITGPIGKECADLWPRIASAANAIV